MERRIVLGLFLLLLGVEIHRQFVLLAHFHASVREPDGDLRQGHFSLFHQILLVAFVGI